MTISRPILAVVLVLYQIFNYFVKNAIEVNQIVAIVKYIIEKWVLIVVKTTQLKNPQQFRNNAPEQQRKEQDVEIRQATLTAAVIYTNNQ
jgi:hypothetical protein